ncbi:MAG: aldo/keto reductase [Bacteroidales bacterium]|nr:aldo/keto reductase [Bacteroidales bacterium]
MATENNFPCNHHSPESEGRRDFLKNLGTITAGAALLPLAGCADKGEKFTSRSGAPSQNGPMEYRTNENTGDKVSLLGYGCMRWPTKKDEYGKDVIDQDAVNSLVDYAIAHGVNYFDTAPVYVQGLSEKSTGIALSRYPRDSYYIATKMSNQRLAGQGRTPEQLYKDSIEMYENSFKELGVDYIDYYLLHSIGGGNGIPLLNERFFDNGLIDFLVKEREKGRIRNLGWSFHGDVEVFNHMLALHDEGKYKWDFAQIQMNYLDWRHAKATNTRNIDAEYLYGELEKRGIKCTIMEPLLGGRLSNVPDHVARIFKEREPERSIASWAFRFCGTYPGVLSILSGMTYMEHLQDNISSLAPLTPLSEDELEFLERTADLMAAYPTIPCNQCQYCMPCPYGIDIPAVFTHYNKCVNEGNMPENRQDPIYRKARKAFLLGYDRSVPRLRQSDHCIGCNQCFPECPQSINIPQQMQRIDRYVESLKQGTL